MPSLPMGVEATPNVANVKVAVVGEVTTRLVTDTPDGAPVEVVGIDTVMPVSKPVP